MIESQRIVDLSFGDERYHLLHDKNPKGATKEDPHFLIVPEGDSGHCDGSQASLQKRLDMLKTAQKAMQFLQDEGFATLLYLERNGPHLQGVKHKHTHVQGIKAFPEGFFAKLIVRIGKCIQRLYLKKN